MRNEIKEDVKEILLIGLGAVAMSADKAKELKGELMEKGRQLYEAGQVKNEELKRTIKDKLSDNHDKNEKDMLIETIKGMSEEELDEIRKYLKIKKSNESK